MKITAENRPINVFISYSWDNAYHKEWVLQLANKLVNNGIDVSLDMYELSLGKSLQFFVENSIKIADRIIIIFTPNYKKKAENRDDGVGYEYSIINSKLYKNSRINNRIIPILKAGNKRSSIPEFMQQYIHLDMTNDDDLELTFIKLLKEFYKESEIE